MHERAIAINKGDEVIDTNALEQAMFGAGCFWGVQAAFDQIKGVRKTTVGYSGGHIDNPTYRQVCYENTGHTEVIHIYFDPSEVTYEELLEVFFTEHDPTQVNRQGPDVGEQYRTVVFYYTESQKETAEAVKTRLNESDQYSRPIATAIEPAKTFWEAEEYHQKYLEKRGLIQCHVK